MVVDLSVQFYDDDLMAYNTVAEIPGTDLKDEIVMLGGHMDSWHSGTGATDNAAGCAVAMEAMRIIKALDLIKPRRTIRIALWSGEEEGLLGSCARLSSSTSARARPTCLVVAPGPVLPAARKRRRSERNCDRKDSSEESVKPRSSPSSPAYFNLDNGTGKIRGVYMQGNESVRPIFRKWLQPFREMGATTLTISNTGGTDHQSFDGIGLPGFQFIQDEVEYDTRTHHSNQDVFDRIQADDMKQASAGDHGILRVQHGDAWMKSCLASRFQPRIRKRSRRGAREPQRRALIISQPDLPRLRPSTMMQERASALIGNDNKKTPDVAVQGIGLDTTLYGARMISALANGGNNVRHEIRARKLA